MLFSSKETLEDKIIRYLVSGEKSANELLGLLLSESKKYTLQAVYGALRSLVDTELIVKRGKIYYLNEEWRVRVASQLQNHTNVELAEGEKVTYNLSSLHHEDLQWKNIVLPLHDEYPSDPIFFFNYHYIWIHLNESRRKSELDYYAAFSKNRVPAYCIIASDSQQDREVKRLIQDEFVQVAIGKKLYDAGEYKTIIGDYIITNILPTRVADEIEECYKKSANTAELEIRLHRLGLAKKKVKLVVERNKLKAKKIRKRFSSEFHIPPELVKTFDLY